MRKAYFQPVDDLALLLVLIRDGGARMFLIPAMRWMNPDKVFANYDYEGQKSAPEFGVRISKAALVALEEYRFGEVGAVTAEGTANGAE